MLYLAQSNFNEISSTNIAVKSMLVYRDGLILSNQGNLQLLRSEPPQSNHWHDLDGTNEKLVQDWNFFYGLEPEKAHITITTIRSALIELIGLREELGSVDAREIYSSLDFLEEYPAVQKIKPFMSVGDNNGLFYLKLSGLQEKLSSYSLGKANAYRMAAVWNASNGLKEEWLNAQAFIQAQNLIVSAALTCLDAKDIRESTQNIWRAASQIAQSRLNLRTHVMAVGTGLKWAQIKSRALQSV